MLRIDRNQRAFVPLAAKKLTDVGLLERSDLQRMILASSKAFFAEMGESLKIIGQEIRPTDFVGDQIDLLALDPDGAAVVIELKRASHKLHLLQALSYAAMISKWSVDNFVDEYARNRTRESARSDIEDFLEQGDLAIVNRSQKVVLIAEDFDFEVLATAEWLYESYDVDIRCYRLELATNNGDEFLTCTRIYPPPELTAQAKRRGTRTAAPPARSLDWPAVLQKIENPAVRFFFEGEAEAGREKGTSSLRFRTGDKLRYWVSAKRTFAYVRQRGRFQDDEQFWAARLSDPSQIRPVTGGTKLRFRLRTEQDFLNFKAAWMEELQKIQFTTTAADVLDADEEPEE